MTWLARDLMSTPVRTLEPGIPLAEARERLVRYGHGAMPVVDSQGSMIGILSRRDLDVALHHGFARSPVEHFLTAQVLTVSPEASLEEIESLMVLYDIGRVPVVERGSLVGIVTRTDLLRAHYRMRTGASLKQPGRDLRQELEEQLPRQAFAALAQAAAAADRLGLVSYLVGGGVRDLLLGLPTEDLDVVVEGTSGEAGAAIALGRAMAGDSGLRLECFEKYQTATVHWPDGFELDLATARTEFYVHPGANPQVESASIQLDLYRRDFTINALAICLNGRRAWQLIDFFGGEADLERRQVRVLHPNSFIEDPTRIFRAVRFALRLDFTIAPQTAHFITRSLADGLHDRYGGDRLKNELVKLLAASFWLAALEQLQKLDALRCIDPELTLSPTLVDALLWLEQIPEPVAGSLKAPTWQLRLERLLLAVPAAAATRLPLDGTAHERLEKVRTLQPVLATTPDAWTVVGLHTYLSALGPEECLLIASLDDVGPHRATLLTYLDRRREPRLLNGNDLAALGLKPGPQYRTILEEAFREQLAGTLRSRAQALEWLRRTRAI